MPTFDEEIFHERARLRALIAATTDPNERQKLRYQLTQLEQQIALRLEMLQINSKT